MKKLLLTATAALLLAAGPAHAAAPASYQVTGPVLAMDADTITVQKGTEKWQIAKGTATVPANVAVGSKVTIKYTMTASSVTPKPGK
jgi:hypothetical protein